MGKYLDILNLDNKTGWPKKFIRYKTGAIVFDMSPKAFERLAIEIHNTYKDCVYKPKKVVWVDARVVEEYIELFPLEKRRK